MHTVELRIERYNHTATTKSMLVDLAFLPRQGETVAVWNDEDGEHEKYIVTQVVHFVGDKPTVYLIDPY